MTGNLSTSQLDSSEIISTGWRLYRQNWSQYALISLKGYLWMFLPIAVVLGTAGILSIQVSAETFSENVGRFIGLVVLATVAFLVVSVFCFAQFLGWTAGISRLVYQTLSGGTESEEAALKFTRSRKYALLWQNFLRGLLFLGTYVVFGLVILVLTLIGFGVLGAVDGEGNGAVGLVVALGAFQLLLFLAFLVFVAWVGLRLMLADQSLALEQDSSAIAAINRSWEATQGNVVRSLQVALFTVLISIPISMAFSIVAQIIATILIGIAPEPESLSADSLAGFIPYLAAVLIMLAGSLGGAIFILPLWHSMLTTLYFRLRSQAYEAG